MTTKNIAVKRDVNLNWAEQYPELTIWRGYAVRWLAAYKKNHVHKLMYLRLFLEKYLLQLNLPMTPESFLRQGAVWPDLSVTVSQSRTAGKQRIHCIDGISDFLSWIIREDFSEDDALGHPVPIAGFTNPVRRISKIANRTIDDPNLRPHLDRSLRWITQIYPELASWRLLAVDWIAGQTGPTRPRLLALQSFFREFIIGRGLPTVPEQFFDVRQNIPDFYEVCLSYRSDGFARPWNSHIHRFADWVLTYRLSIVEPDGKLSIPGGYHNPISSRVKKALGKSSDMTLAWVSEKRPELEEWRNYAATWLARETRGVETRLRALLVFFER